MLPSVIMICFRCKDSVFSEDALLCVLCKNQYHFLCVGVGEKNFKKMSKVNKEKFKCPTCKLNNSPPPNNEELEKEKAEKSPFKLNSQEEKNEDMKEYFETKFQHLENKMDALVENLKSEFNKRLETLENQLEVKNDIIEDLETRLDELEIRSRIANIEIRGVPETRGEDVKTIVEHIGRVIGCGDIHEGDIQVAHRVFSKQPRGPKPIVAHLGSRHMKNKWIAAYKQCKASRQFAPLLASELNSSLPETQIYVYEHITTKRKILLAETRDFAKKADLKYVWTREGAIFVREKENDQVHKITTAKHLAEVKLVFRNKISGTPDINA